MIKFNKTLILLIISSLLIDCQKKEEDDTVKNLFLLNAFANATRRNVDSTWFRIPSENFVKMVSFQNNLYGIVSGTSSANSAELKTSSDGNTWTRVRTFDERVFDMSVINNTLYIVGGNTTASNTGKIFSSTNGTTWTQNTYTGTLTLRSISGINGLLAVTGTNNSTNSFFSVSADGNTWNTFSQSPGASDTKVAVHTNGSVYVIGTSGRVFTCTNNCTSTANFTGTTISALSGASSPYVASNGTNTLVYYSTSVTYRIENSALTQYTSTGLPSDNSVQSLEFTGNKFVVSLLSNVGSNFSVYSSTDGSAWTQVNIGGSSYGDNACNGKLFTSNLGTFSMGQIYICKSNTTINF
jgi:prolyl oligopeptidase PreP (S9A serine peptidase family)